MSANKFIKKSTVSVRNSPVSTFRFNAASGKRFANEIEKQGDELFRTAVAEGQNTAKKDSKDIALGLDSNKIITTDDKGRPIALQIDTGLGSIGQEVFQATIDERYIHEWDKKLKLKANEIFTNSLLEKHPHAVFKTRMSTFINDHVNSVEDSFYNGIVKNIGAEYQAEYSQKYQLTKVQQQVEDITVNKINDAMNKSLIYVQHLKEFGQFDLKTIEKERVYNNALNDPFYTRLVPPSERLKASNQHKVDIAWVHYEKVLDFLVSSNNFDSIEMKQYHEALSVSSESNQIIKTLKEKYPQISNSIKVLYENTDGIGLSGERNKFGNKTGSIIVAHQAEKNAKSSHESALAAIQSDTNRILTSTDLMSKGESLFNNVTTEAYKHAGIGNFEKLEELKEIYLKQLEELIGTFESSSFENINPKLFNLLSDENKEIQIEKENAGQKIAIQKFKETYYKHVNRQFESIKLQGKVEYHINSQDKSTLYGGFTVDYLTYLQTGNEKYAGQLPDDIKKSIDLIHNGDHWEKDKNAIIKSQKEYFLNMKDAINKAEIDHTTRREEEFNKEMLIQHNDLIQKASLVHDKEYGVPSHFIFSDDKQIDTKIDDIYKQMELVFDKYQMFADLPTTSKQYKAGISVIKQQLKDDLHRSIFTSYISNINGTTEEGMDQLVNLKNYFQRGGNAFGKTKKLDENNMSAITNIYNKISPKIQEKIKDGLFTSIGTIIAHLTPSSDELAIQEAIKNIKIGGVYKPDKYTDAAMVHMIDSMGMDFTADWKKVPMEQIMLFGSFLKKNYVHKSIIGQFKNFSLGNMSNDKMINMYKNLQAITTYVGEQGQPFNVEIHKIFSNEDNKDMASDLEAILIGANTLETPIDRIPAFVREVANFDLRSPDSLAFNKDTIQDIYTKVREGLKANSLYDSQINQVFGGKISNFMIEKVANLVSNSINQEGSTEYKKGESFIINKTVEGLINRIVSEMAPNYESEALITGQHGNKTFGNNNVKSTFHNLKKEKAFWNTIRLELFHHIKPVDSNKKYVLAEDYNRTRRALSSGTKLEEYQNQHIPVYITPNFIISGRYPVFMAMVEDKYNFNLVPLHAKHLTGEEKGKISYATWDSESWDQKYVDREVHHLDYMLPPMDESIMGGFKHLFISGHGIGIK